MYLQKFCEAEKEIACYCQTKDRLKLYTPVGGFQGNPTRAELDAATGAILANGAVQKQNAEEGGRNYGGVGGER